METRNTLRALVFDLDNTLYEYAPHNDRASKAVITFLATELNRPAEAVNDAYFAARRQVNKQIHSQAASHSRLLYIQLAIERLIGSTNPRLTLLGEKLFWDTYLQETRLRPGARSLIKKAKALGLKVGILSDLTTAIQFRKMVKLGLAVDAVVTSEESGAEKPELTGLDLLLAKLGVARTEAVIIGDSHERDGGLAKQAGIDFILLDKDEDVALVQKQIVKLAKAKQ